MSAKYEIEEIKAAIETSDVDRARTLLQEALKDPTAETYFLASQVALDEPQRKRFLEKALKLDPFHEQAFDELQYAKKPSTGTVVPPSSTSPPIKVVEPTITVDSPGSQSDYRSVSLWVWVTLAIVVLVIVGSGAVWLSNRNGNDAVSSNYPVSAMATEAGTRDSLSASKETSLGTSSPTVSSTPTRIPTIQPTNTSKPTAKASPTVPPSRVPDTGEVRLFSLPSGETVNMVYIPVGSFPMGSDEGEEDESPVHDIYLDAYWIDQTEVTNAEYKACVAADICRPPIKTSSYTTENYSGDPRFDDYPVIWVSWQQATTFCSWRNGRLPTEAEWEKAARGSSQSTYPWGNEPANCTLLNFNRLSCMGEMTPGGSYPLGASPYGVLDMAGNEREYVADWYDSDYYEVSPTRNPQGPATGDHYVIRGGSWWSRWDYARVTGRFGGTKRGVSIETGFRCADSEG